MSSRGQTEAGQAYKRALNSRDPGPISRLLGIGLKGLPIAALIAIVLWVVSTYGNALRDPRYLDGWLLAGGICFQFLFHVAVSGRMLSPKIARRWRRLHIALGYLMIPIFVLHSDYSLPDTGLEWALWMCFVLISLSGVFGIYVAWSLKSRDVLDGNLDDARLAAQCAKLDRDVHAIMATAHPASATTALPPPPYDAWIRELYSDSLMAFFERRPSFLSQLIGSRNRLQWAVNEIDALTDYVDEPSRNKLSAIKKLVVEKDRLDASHFALILSRGWLQVHVPVTYMLIILTVVHVLVVYAFSSGAW